MYQETPASVFLQIINTGRPAAVAWIQGSAASPRLSGLVRFHETPYGGILVEAQVFGLPNIGVPGSSDFFGMHIHEYGNCEPPFARTGEHYNPSKAPHPQHAGDLPPLMGNQGYAYQIFYDKRFTLDEILGKSVVIHSGADDFQSQPSGNSGEKIGCGVIQAVR